MWKKVAVVWPQCALAVTLCLLYNDWLLGPILNPRMSTNRSLISELSATSQPYHWVFRSLDITAGILTLGCCSLVWRLFSTTTRRIQWALTGLFLVIGLDSIIDAMLPISCAPSVDLQCNLFATHSALTTAHLIESNIAGTIIAIVPLVWWRYHRTKQFRFIAEVSLWLVFFEAWIGVAALTVRFSHHGTYGLIQRAYEVALGMWVGLIVYVAVGVRNGGVEHSQLQALISSNDAAVSS
jgi:hypothetical protein